MADVEEDGPVEEASGGAAGGAATAGKRFEVKKWNAVGQPAACDTRRLRREAVARTRANGARARRRRLPAWLERAGGAWCGHTGSSGGPAAGGRARPPAGCVLPRCAPFLSTRRCVADSGAGKSLRRTRWLGAGGGRHRLSHSRAFCPEPRASVGPARPRRTCAPARTRCAALIPSDLPSAAGCAVGMGHCCRQLRYLSQPHHGSL